MEEMYKLNLQLFADGADGGAPESSEGSTDSGEDVPAFIPERAKETYRKAMAKTKPTGDTRGESTEAIKPQEEVKEHVAYADLIKSDEYKDEHKAYMDKTIGDRLKKYKGLEEKQSNYDEILGIIGGKYGLDVSSESFMDDLRAKVEADDSYYENYAMEHDISTDEARRVVALERKVMQAEAKQRADEQQALEAEQERANRERFNRLLSNAEATKARFPEFNFEAEMQNERFRNLCAVNNEDTTAAYMAVHWNEIIPGAMQMASQRAQIQTANAIAAGKNRPIESGLSSTASAVVEQDFSKMNLKELREYAESQRRMKH